MKIFLFISASFFPLIGFTQHTPPKYINLDSASVKHFIVGEKPDFLTASNNNVWIVDDHQNRVLKMSPISNLPLLTVSIPHACGIPAVGFHSLWVASCSEKMLYRINDSTGKLQAKIPIGLADLGGEMSIAIGDGSIWLLTDSIGILTRINPVTNKVLAEIKVLPHSYCTAFGHHSIWVTNFANNSIQRINPTTNKIIATIPIGPKPRFFTISKMGVWALHQGDGTIGLIDVNKNTLIKTINVKAPGGGGDIDAVDGKVWVVSTNTENPIQRIDEKTGKIEFVFVQTRKSNDNTPFKVDGGIRHTIQYIWMTGYYSKSVWLIKR